MMGATRNNELPPAEGQVPAASVPPGIGTTAMTMQPDPLTIRDVNAQEAMVFWAMGMFWVTVLSLAVAAIALGGLIKQIGQNRRSSEQQLRAYLAVKPLGIVKLIGSSHVIGQVLLRNVGSTLAQNVCLEVKAIMVQGDIKPEFPVRDDPGNVPRSLHPGDEMVQGSINSLLLGDIQSPDNVIYIWGIAHYDDGFGKRRSTRFCHRYACVSHDREAYRKSTAKGVREAVIIIAAEKSRLNEKGNDAE